MTEVTESIPEEFTKVIRDFVKDVRTTFPEYESFITKWWKPNEYFHSIENEEEQTTAYESSEKKSIQYLFDFCQKKLPPRFFDILYQNEDMFKEESDIDTEFLPKIHFKNLWQCDISQKTRETIWKYLQLILFSIVGTIHNKEAFGDSAKMFEAINQEEFKTKLEETLSHMQGLFDMSGINTSEDSSENLGEGYTGNIPNAESIHEHISSMMNGKLGQLARDIAEETAANLNMDMENVSDMKDVLNNLMKNPTKLMGLVKTVGDKLDTKIKSGEMKESELIAEATEMMNKMKQMPGMDNIQSMLSKMGMGNLGGLGGKVNVGAMEAQMKKNLQMAKTKERMRANAEANRKAKMDPFAQKSPSSSQNVVSAPSLTEEELIKIFSTGEKGEKTPRNANPHSLKSSNTDKKKKKSKK
jgi:hypothetical protein